MDIHPPLYIPSSRECMTCGFCLPSCPTYAHTKTEIQSPRGRIRLLEKVIQGNELTNEDRKAVEDCLLCRQCETVCPSKMPYGNIYNRARMQLQPHVGPTESLIRWSLVNKPVRKILASITQLVALLPLQAILQSARPRILSLLGAITETNSLKKKKRFVSQASVQSPRGKLGLFVGCLSDLTDTDTINQVVFILNSLGYEIVIPKNQQCCGAMHLHAGNMEKADRLARANLRAFNLDELEAVITFSSACGLTLREYETREGFFKDDSNTAMPFSDKVKDISEFLAETQNLEMLKEKMLPQHNTALIHHPCSLQNPLGLHKHTETLLSAIPGLESQAVAKASACCGAAGTRIIKDGSLSGELSQPFIDAVKVEHPDFLVTSNTGCALHLRRNLRQHSLTTPVVHPIELIAARIADGHR